MLGLKEFRFGFGNALTEEESAELFGTWEIPSPARVLFEAAAALFRRPPADASRAQGSRPGPGRAS